MYQVLLIEDNPGDIELTRIAFEESGLDVGLQTATSHRDALRQLEALQTAPDLILLDLNLGDGSGHDVLARVRQDPELSRVPVVVITTSDYPQDRARAADLGATDYVVKPNSFDRFVELVRGLAPLLAV